MCVMVFLYYGALSRKTLCIKQTYCFVVTVIDLTFMRFIFIIVILFIIRLKLIFDTKS